MSWFCCLRELLDTVLHTSDPSGASQEDHEFGGDCSSQTILNFFFIKIPGSYQQGDFLRGKKSQERKGAWLPHNDGPGTENQTIPSLNWLHRVILPQQHETRKEAGYLYAQPLQPQDHPRLCSYNQGEACLSCFPPAT